MKIVNAIQNTLTPDIIRAGYKETGQYPLDYNKAMHHCRSELTLDMHNYLKEMLPYVAQCFSAQGFVTESELDAMGIVSVNSELRNQKPKDERVLHQQRAVIMNYEEVSERYQLYQETKRVKAEAAQKKAPTTPKKKRVRADDPVTTQKDQNIPVNAGSTARSRDMQKNKDARIQANSSFNAVNFIKSM